MKNLTVSIMAALCAVVFSGVGYASTPDCPSCDSWAPASSANYTDSSRPASYPIQYVIIHKAEGSAAGAVSWYQNSAAAQSYHYVFGKSGYSYQCARDADIAWIANIWNYNTTSIGLAHGGYANSNDTTTACYDASAAKARSCMAYYDVSLERIIGLDEVPGSNVKSDPGPYWNWDYYLKQCLVGPAGPPAFCLIDDKPACSSNWGLIAGTSGAFYGQFFRWHITSSSIPDPATFRVKIPIAGNYKISAFWSMGTNRNPSATYILPNGSTVVKSQQFNGGQWNFLGTQYLGTGWRTVTLPCYGPTGYVVIADAVRFCYVP